MLVDVSELNTSVQAFEDYGYVVLPGLLTAGESQELYGAFDSFPGAHVDGSERNFYTERVLTTHWGFVEAVTKPALIEALRHCVGDDLQILSYDGPETPPTRVPSGHGTSRSTAASRRTRASASMRASISRI